MYFITSSIILFDLVSSLVSSVLIVLVTMLYSMVFKSSIDITLYCAFFIIYLYP